MWTKNEKVMNYWSNTTFSTWKMIHVIFQIYMRVLIKKVVFLLIILITPVLFPALASYVTLFNNIYINFDLSVKTHSFEYSSDTYWSPSAEQIHAFTFKCHIIATRLLLTLLQEAESSTPDTIRLFFIFTSDQNINLLCLLQDL